MEVRLCAQIPHGSCNAVVEFQLKGIYTEVILHEKSLYGKSDQMIDASTLPRSPDIISELNCTGRLGCGARIIMIRSLRVKEWSSTLSTLRETS